MSYATMTVTDLKAECARKGITGVSRLKKAELVATLNDLAGRIDPSKVTGQKPQTEPRATAIRCGKCHKRHGSVAEVRACYGVRVRSKRSESRSTGIRCGACNGRHASVAAVSACYKRS